MADSVSPPREDVWVHSTCANCISGCPIRVRRVDGVAVKVEGDPSVPSTQGRICGKGNSGLMMLYDPYRVKAPLKRTNPEKGMDVDPRWVEITWDEAYDILEKKLRPIREEDPNGLCFISWDYSNLYYERCFGSAFGTAHCGMLFTGTRSNCGEATHTLGMIVHGSYLDFADYQYCNYLLVAGGGLFEGWLTAVPSSRMVGERREKGMKLVVVDPRGTGAAAKADEWVPVRPGTDGALFLAMMHVLVHEVHIYDAEFLKKVTNAPYLIGPDRHLVRDPATGKPLVWDAVEGQAKTYDDTTIKDFALEGTYEVEGTAARPAFDLFTEHVQQYSPEWAEGITTIPAERIRRIARELGEATRIGSTIVIGGREYPYRPACVVGYRGLNAHTNSWTSVMAQETINLLLGTTRVPGGLQGMNVPQQGLGWPQPAPLPAGPDGMVLPQVVTGAFRFPPVNIALREFWPLTAGSHIPFLVQAHPEKFKLEKPIKAIIYQNNNPMNNSQDPRVVAEALSSIPFVADITIHLDETTRFADLVLPERTYLERWVMWNGTQLDEGAVLTQPVVKPLHNTREAMEILLELARRLGILTGPSGLLRWINTTVGKEVLNIQGTYTWPEIVAALFEAAWDRPIEWFMEHGHNLHPLPPEKKYLIWGNRRMPFYHHWVMEQGEALRSNMEQARTRELIGLDPDEFARSYWPMPTWEPAIIHKDDPKYDMYAISFKTSLTRFATLPDTNPWLMEIAERDPFLLRVLMNTGAGRKKGLCDGDLVWVESKAGRVKAQLRLTELMHEETLGFPGNFGHRMAHPIAQGRGPHFNSLLPMGLDYTARVTGALEATARVRVYKA
ncbi:MAG: molybdopterin-dependent oxidoreductase [Chloroflexi bacterium]|nr:molybdopterin-dependent oxidoreductase [Chloroflexota bacterium]